MTQQWFLTSRAGLCILWQWANGQFISLLYLCETFSRFHNYSLRALTLLNGTQWVMNWNLARTKRSKRVEKRELNNEWKHRTVSENGGIWWFKKEAMKIQSFIKESRIRVVVDSGSIDLKFKCFFQESYHFQLITQYTYPSTNDKPFNIFSEFKKNKYSYSFL